MVVKVLVGTEERWDLVQLFPHLDLPTCLSFNFLAILPYLFPSPIL